MKKWNHWKPQSNVETVTSARYTAIRANGKPVHANKREIIRFCQSEGINQVTNRATGEIIKVNLATGKFEV